MEITAGFILSGGMTIIPRPAPLTTTSGDPALALGDQINWSSNTYFYTAGSPTLAGSDHQYDTNNMVWQLFYAHRQISIPVGANRYGPIPRQGGNNTVGMRAIVSPTENDRDDWGSNVTTITGTATSITYTGNVLYQLPTSTAITIPAKRYFLLGILGGPFYRNYKKTANNITAINGSNAIVTAVNQVYAGIWPGGTNPGVPIQAGGNVAGTYISLTSNLYYSAFKFEIV